ncbi:uncharacterized protein L969DRAFT_88837 [Mixia osmundae IAM 14324]|uniref:Vacuolar protein sorting-associated protein 35 n=1 Tax=Mixia osmundae (strain CBS 9802 / IAM 14324 / JCM 22182 / KY 12970) TaxID=764103 RepID=G7E7I2_MIXOS|nr:uncharacterized protein L969DRAFT_88837 [Mixia osmundae IAM 14324]KEI38395.1 hypothetical protein L969DRAFT_88837 [Mixia osmundae IAM 14324]GAA98792.1 hypothetical protein E5Q_05480 [Mixia osmundae IAM 14324]
MASAEDGKSLADALAVVQAQSVLMRRTLTSDGLMPGLKAASTMLAELRTSSLSPKAYYELYVACDLRHLSSYLFDSHTSGKHHLADLYELVQYAGNIVPRLYLMITVGSVYMSIPDAPVKEIMKDMMEMTRGVQHPTRGLFLRNYLSAMTRDHLPVGDSDGPGGNLQDSIGFVLTNFIEMNKLWVRLQHQGLSRDRDRRELERKELRILVGTNLVRLSQLDGVDLEMYQRIILPSVLEQVVNCKDVIAQEYLMEVVIQVFTDDFHIRTLGPFLSATAQLHPKVNIKAIVIALIDRLAAHAAREAENESPEEFKRQKDEEARRLALKIKEQKAKRAAVTYDDEDEPSQPPVDTMLAPEVAGFADAADAKPREPEPIPDAASPATSSLVAPPKDETAPTSPRKFRGIPEDVRLFEVFWHQIVELVKARPDLGLNDITALLVSLTNLSLSCYPDRLEYIDQIFDYTQRKVSEFADSPDLHHPLTIANLLSLLLSPINSYTSILTILALPCFNALLAIQPHATRRSIAHAVVASILKNETLLETPEDVKGVLDLCQVLIKDQRDAQMPNGGRQFAGMPRAPQYDPEEMAEEQGWLARMLHLFYSDNVETQYKLLQTARKELSEGGDRIRWTFPPLIVASIKLARRYKYKEHELADYSHKTATLFKFIHQVINSLYIKVESSEICLRLYLLALQAADEADNENLAYEFAVRSFEIYEDGISDSKAQLQAIVLIIGTLQQMRVFATDNYDTLITKAALHGAKLLKKGHQATAVALASHLWWQTDTPHKKTPADKQLLQDGKRVLECLQKALRIATSCIDELTTVQIYVDTLDQYIYYYERQVEAISIKHINSLIELITANIDTLHATDVHPTSLGSASGLVEGNGSPEGIVKHFRSTLVYLASRRDTEDDKRWQAVELAGPMLKLGLS